MTDVIALCLSFGTHVESASGENGLKPALVKGGAAAANAVDPASKHGETALMICAEKGALEKVKALLAAGAKIDAVDKVGNTPLHYAVAGGNAAVVKALLDAKASPATKNKEKISAAALARAKGYADCAVLMK